MKIGESSVPLKRLLAVLLLGLVVSGCGGGNSPSPGEPGNSALAEQDFTSISAGYSNICGIVTPGSLWCWAPNSTGSDQPHHQASGPFPATQVGTDTDWLQVSTQNEVICGIRDGGSLWCWGSNLGGRVGVGSADDKASYDEPKRVLADTQFRSVDVGNHAVCAVSSDDQLWCWGSNLYGSVGDGTNTDASSPVQVGADTAWDSVSSGKTITCALDTDHNEWCWGGAEKGQRENAKPNPRIPGERKDTSLTWSAIDVSGHYLCGLDTETNLRCDFDDEIGLGVNTWQSFGYGGSSLCAINEVRTLFCVGGNDNGSLGTANFRDSSIMIKVAGPDQWVAVSVGEGENCGIDRDGAAWCWGATANKSGQDDAVGLIDPSVPMKIVLPRS
jgi:alpha-tubulin suppressor-like RCC1 family protein